MNDEKLFEMLEIYVADAVAVLEKGERLDPFAMILEADDTHRPLYLDEPDTERRYDLLHQALKAEAAHGEIKAAALLARVTIPENYGPAVPEGIRIHVEERASAHEKLSARLLYIPYQLYRAEGQEYIRVHLHHPIPVGMPSEIFKS